MERARNVVQLIATGGVAAVLVAGATPGWAQPAAPAPKPAVDRARIVVTMGQDGNDTVEATYTVVNTIGLKEGVLEHALVRQPGAELGEIQVSGAAGGAPTVDRHEGISTVKIAVSGEPATYTLRYGVRRAAGTFAVPLLTPRIPVAKSAPNVTIETALPSGTKADGEWFPSVERFDTRDGRTVLVHRVINIPSVAIAEYDRGGFLNPSLWTTILGFGFLTVLVVWWFRHSAQRRPAAGP